MNEKELEKLHKALANRRRIAIVQFLKSGKDADLTALSAHLKLGYKSTSKHAGQLCAAGILDKDTRGGIVYFSISKTVPALAAHTLKLL